MNKTISYKEKIEEIPFFYEKHENQLTKRLDSLTLEKPIFLLRSNPITFNFEGLKVTKKVLDFLKENRERNLKYNLYIDYSFRPSVSFEELGDDDPIEFHRIDENEFIETERVFWKYKRA